MFFDVRVPAPFRFSNTVNNEDKNDIGWESPSQLSASFSSVPVQAIAGRGDSVINSRRAGEVHSAESAAGPSPVNALGAAPRYRS